MEDDLLVPERWDRIRASLDQNGRVTVEELAERFCVSRSTIRRDLMEMHERSLLIRTRGGAVRSQMVSFDRPLVESGAVNVEAKEKIGRTAAELISVGETIMLDSGATTSRVVANLQASNITLVTNSFAAATIAMSKPEVELIMIGGMVRSHGGATIGPTAEDQTLLFKADTAILGINGISAYAGLTTPNLLVAQMKRAMIRQSKRLIVVADHTKLSATALCVVAPIQAVSILVTDDQADPDMVNDIRNAGVEVIVAR